jgi:hypothetical protein
MPAKELTPEQKADAARLKAIYENRKHDDPSLTQEALAHMCDWKTQGAVSQYMLGRVPLNLPALIKFSKALEVPAANISPSLAGQIADFVFYNKDGTTTIIELKQYPGDERRKGDRRHPVERPADAYNVPMNRYRFPPVIGKGIGGRTDRDYGDADYPAGASDQFAEVPTADPNAFITPIFEDSMYPKFSKGDYALVEPNTPVDLEDDVLVKSTAEGPVLKRLLSRRGGMIRLGSYNRQDVITIPEEEIVWMYYVAFPVPAKKIKNRI